MPPTPGIIPLDSKEFKGPLGKFSLTKTIVNIQTANLSININSWIDSGAYFNIQRKNKKVQEYYSNTNLNEYTLGTAI